MASSQDSGTTERRAHERLTKALPVHLRRGNNGDSFEASIVNISGGGVLIQTDMQLTQNDLLAIDLDLAGEKEPIYVYGTVVRSDARGVGVAFVRISEITADLISYLIRKWQQESATSA